MGPGRFVSVPCCSDRCGWCDQGAWTETISEQLSFRGHFQWSSFRAIAARRPHGPKQNLDAPCNICIELGSSQCVICMARSRMFCKLWVCLVFCRVIPWRALAYFCFALAHARFIIWCLCVILHRLHLSCTLLVIAPGSEELALDVTKARPTSSHPFAGLQHCNHIDPCWFHGSLSEAPIVFPPSLQEIGGVENPQKWDSRAPPVLWKSENWIHYHGILHSLLSGSLETWDSGHSGHWRSTIDSGSQLEYWWVSAGARRETGSYFCVADFSGYYDEGEGGGGKPNFHRSQIFRMASCENHMFVVGHWIFGFGDRKFNGAPKLRI
jgi:hypothetical protein